MLGTDAVEHSLDGDLFKYHLSSKLPLRMATKTFSRLRKAIHARIQPDAYKPHNQLQSPLFGTLFPELRNIVFIYALTEYDDETWPYSEHSWYYCPGFAYKRKIAKNLLLTCRLVHLETHTLPAAINEHVFWMFRPPPGEFVSNYEAYFGRISPRQRGAVQRVRFFTQMYWLENRRAPPHKVVGDKAKPRERAQVWAPGINVPKLTITIRHSDWWYWERRERLRIQAPSGSWGDWIASVPGLEELKFELESIDAKRVELEERVHDAMRWRFLLKGGGCLVHDGERPAESTWVGTSALAPPGDTDVLDEMAPWIPHGIWTWGDRLPVNLTFHIRTLTFKLA